MWQWIVSFSNGERASSKNLITGDKINPWTKILDYLKKNKLKITHLELIINGVRYNSPSSSKNSLFYSEDFDKFQIFYKSSAELRGSSDQDLYVAYSYKCGDYRHIFWVNTKSNFCYSQILNVVNPKTQEEIAFMGIEKDIEKSYGSDPST